MKILLVEPPDNSWVLGGARLFVFEPLGLEYLAAGLPGHDVRILDMRFDGDLAGTLRDFEPDVVGFSGFTVHARTVRRLAGEVKAHDRRTRTVLGGHHASVAPGECAWRELDAVLPGEGVFSFADLVRAWADGGDGSGIPGVRLVRDGALVDGGPRTAQPLDAYPAPRRDLTERWRERYFSEWMSPIASVRTSRGCPFRCDFCSLWKTAEGKYWRRSPEAVVEELRTVSSPNVFFADDESLVDHRRMHELGEAIVRSGIRKSYFMYGRADTVARHPELIALWRRAGLSRLFVGLEAADGGDLDRMNKGTSAEDNVRAIEVLKREGVTINANFIVDPEWERADFDRLLAFVRAMDLEYPAFSILTPLPGTELHERTRASVTTGNTDLYDLLHPVTRPRLGYARFYREYMRLWSESVPARHRMAVLARYGWRRLPRTLIDQGVLVAKGLLTGAAYATGVMEKMHYREATCAPRVPMTVKPPPGGPEVYR